MPSSTSTDAISEYISRFPPDILCALEQVRTAIHTATPEAIEVISYKMPAYKLHGRLVYFAAWKKHIGLYPPVSGDKAIEKAVARYAGENGNLQFPLNEPMPIALISKIVKLRVKQGLAKAASSKKTSLLRKKEMTPQQFRKLALSFPDTTESEHGGHPDFRFQGKVFASLGAPSDDWGMVKFTEEQQRAFCEVHPETFQPCNGAWGRSGYTNFKLEAAKVTAVRSALILAIENLSASKPSSRTASKRPSIKGQKKRHQP